MASRSQQLRTAFWSLAISLGLLLLLLIVRPVVTAAVTGPSGPRFDGSVANADSSRKPAISRDASDWSPPASAGSHPARSQRARVEDRIIRQRPPHSRPLRQPGSGGPFFEPEPEPLAARQQPTSKPEPESTKTPAAPKPPATVADPQTIARLEALQATVERLAQAVSDRQLNDIDRMRHRLELIHQSDRLRKMEREIDQLKIEQPVAAPPATIQVNLPPSLMPAPPKAPPEAAVDAASPNEGERFSLQILNAALTEVLELLGRSTGHSVLIGKGVGGTVASINLENVTLEEALDSIVRSVGLEYEKDGEFVFVMTAAEYEARRKTASRPAIPTDKRATPSTLPPSSEALQEARTHESPLERSLREQLPQVVPRSRPQAGS